MTSIKRTTSSTDIQLTAELAATIWTEHYTPIIGKAQVDYMVANFQSEKAITEQISKGAEYYLIYYSKIPVGYICIQQKGEELFLSKIYILAAYRGKKIGKTAMVFIEEQAITKGCTKIGLTVNKHNSKSISAYEKLGFKNVGALVQDIGNGFVMDDYKMEKSLAK